MNAPTAVEWLTNPALTAKLAEFKADRERAWRIVDRTFDERTHCVAGNRCPWLNVTEDRRGAELHRCDLRIGDGDAMDCAGVEAAAREECGE